MMSVPERRDILPPSWHGFAEQKVVPMAQFGNVDVETLDGPKRAAMAETIGIEFEEAGPGLSHGGIFLTLARTRRQAKKAGA